MSAAAPAASRLRCGAAIPAGVSGRWTSRRHTWRFARGREGGESIRFEHADAAKLPFDAGRFAGSIAQLVLNFVPDPRQAVQEMRRVTRSGGVVVGAVWDFRALAYQRLFWDAAAALDPQAAITRDRLISDPLAQAGGLIGIWQEGGLRDIQGRSLAIRMDFGSFEDYWAPLLGGQGPFGSYVAGLPDGRRAVIRAAVRDAYCSGGPDGPRSLAATAWAVRGRVR
jgi:SAM-dependent methyltransferase